MTRTLVLWVAALGLLPFTGCKSDMSSSTQDSGPDLGGPDVDFISCADEPRAPPFQQGMQVTSTGGRYLVTLVRNTFTDASGIVLTEAPAKGVDVWTVKTETATTMSPVDGVAISVRPYMPDHAHGTTSVGVMPVGGGIYTLSPLNLYMAGYWEVTLTIVDSSGDAPASDTAVFKVCVPN